MNRFIQLFFTGLVLPATGLWAQTVSTPDSLDLLSLEQLMEVRVTIATQSEQTARETPGIVSVITRSDIEQMQAVDLVDILRWIPGLDIAQDVDMALSISSRGIWGQEGKVLLILDGHELQETAYGGYQLAGRYPAQIIERIEIIRGPGSVVYGGNAALSVVNITTRNAVQSPALSFSLQNGINQHGLTKTRINTEAALVKGDFHAKGSLSISSGRYGTGQIALAGDNGNDSLVYDLNQSAGPKELLAGITVGWKKWELKWLGNFYQHPSYRNLTYSQNMQDFILHNTWKLRENLELNTQATVKIAGPWNTVQDSFPEYFDNVRNTRSGIRSYLRYKSPKRLELTAGLEGYYDNQEYRQSSPFNPTRAPQFSLYNLSSFGQAMYKSDFGTLTAGARFDYNSVFGSFFVPRVAYTKIWNDWHLKLLYSNAYRTPSLYNLKLAPDAVPEFLETFETEFGFTHRNHRVSLNVFLNNLFNPVLFEQTIDGIDTYRNGTRTGSKGLEVDYTGVHRQWKWSLNYAFNMPHENQIEAFSLVGNNQNFIAFAAHRVNARLSVTLVKGWNLQLNQQFWSERFSQNPELPLVKVDAQWLSGLMLLKRWDKHRVQLSLGVQDIFNTRLTTIQAFRGYVSPFRGFGREFLFSISKSFARL